MEEDEEELEIQNESSEEWQYTNKVSGRSIPSHSRTRDRCEEEKRE